MPQFVPVEVVVRRNVAVPKPHHGAKAAFRHQLLHKKWRRFLRNSHGRFKMAANFQLIQI